MQPDIDASIMTDLSELVAEIYKPSGSFQQSTEMSALHYNVFKIWHQVLGFDDFGVDDDLFEVGGDSIAAVQIFSAVNTEFGVNLSMQELFSSEHFSIRWLADLINKYQIELVGKEEYSALLDQIEGLSEEEVQALLLAQG